MATLVEQVKAVLDAYGLGSLSQWIVDQEVAGNDELTILTAMRALPEYKARFPAMEALRIKAQAGGAAGAVAITEGEYLQMERAYRDVFSRSGLPANMWDTPDDFKRLIEADVSPDEVQRRVAAAKEAVDSTDPNVRSELQRLYGITTTDLMAYALDPAKNSDYLKKIATTAIIAGYGKSSGLSASNWESYAGDVINQQIGDEGLRTIIGQASMLAEDQSRLANIEGSRFTDEDALDVVLRKDAAKTTESKRRAEREKARFSGSTGITSASLAKSGI